MSESKQEQSELLQQIKELNKQCADLKTAVTEIKNQYIDAEKRHIDQINNVMALNQANIAEVRKLSFDLIHCFGELNFANLLHDTIVQSPWLKDKTFSLFSWAANYSFIYTLYRILDKINPTNILEMGIGQTTRLTSQYIAHKNPKAHLTVCEHDPKWIEFYKPDLPENKNIDIKKFDLEYFMYENKENDKYAGLAEYVGKQKFDLVIIDGPFGFNRNLPRTNILDLITNDNLADDFIIIFNDAERAGEQATIVHAESLLRNKNIDFISYARQGLKRQHIIASSSHGFANFL